MSSLKMSAINSYNKFEDFFVSLFENNILIELTVSVGVVNDPPVLVLQLDENKHEHSLTDGEHELNFKFKLAAGKHKLSLGMRGKIAGETIVENGTIVKDKFIQILKLKINNYDIVNSYDFHKMFRYQVVNSSDESNINFGFWDNADLILDFESPFELFYNTHSNNNAELAGALRMRNSSVTDEARIKLYRSLDKLIK